VNMFGSGESNGITWSATGDNPMGLGKPLSNSGFNIGSSSLQAYVNALEQSGVMKTLAEPTLTAVSGEKATFKVGGEYNIVSSQSITDPDITKGIPSKLTYQLDKVEYGIGLEFQPVVLSAGRISLKVRTAVSEPTTEGSA
ncbi:pilus assembly protein CpaC, partial [Mesorhizobium sp. M2C.T.Ca.TU.009.01.2.1]